MFYIPELLEVVRTCLGDPEKGFSTFHNSFLSIFHSHSNRFISDFRIQNRNKLFITHNQEKLPFVITVNYNFGGTGCGGSVTAAINKRLQNRSAQQYSIQRRRNG